MQLTTSYGIKMERKESFKTRLYMVYRQLQGLLSKRADFLIGNNLFSLPLTSPDAMAAVPQLQGR